MATRKKAIEYRVIKTFDSPQGLKRPGEVLTFKSAKDAAHMVAAGYLEMAEPAKPVRKTAEKVKAKSHVGAKK